MVVKKQIQVLKDASSSKRNDTLKRVIYAIKVMQEKNILINFQTVAKHAAVSKTWLYGEATIRKQINSLRDKSDIRKRATNLHDLNQKKETEIKKLHTKIKVLEKTIVKMKKQLEVAYGEIYCLNSSKK